MRAHELNKNFEDENMFLKIKQQASQWNPKFFYTDNAFDCADAINKPHEDYPARVKSTKEIIEMLVSENYTTITEFDVNSVHSYIFKNSRIATGIYRKISVSVRSHTPPDGIHISELISNIFPISIGDNLQEWYSLFQTIHPYEDGNGRVGGTIIAVLSKLKIDKYLTPKK